MGRVEVPGACGIRATSPAVKELAVAIKDADASTGAIAVHGIPGENAGVKAELGDEDEISHDEGLTRTCHVAPDGEQLSRG